MKAEKGGKIIMPELEEWKNLGRRLLSLGRGIVSRYLDEAEKSLLEEKPSTGKTYTCGTCGEVFGNRFKFAAHHSKHKERR